MITVSRLNGVAFALNADLIERVDVTPDTVITLVDGTKYLVAESLAEVVEAVREFRASVIARSASIEISPAKGPDLRVVPATPKES